MEKTLIMNPQGAKVLFIYHLFIIFTAIYWSNFWENLSEFQELTFFTGNAFKLNFYYS